MAAKFPVLLKHPGFQPAIISTELSIPGRSVRFPPVMVNSQNEVDYYQAQGYEVTDKIDPRYFEPVAGDAPTYVNQRYPSWEHGVLVKDETQHRALFPHDFVAPESAPLESPATATIVTTQSALMGACGASMEAPEDASQDDAALVPPAHEQRFG
jgi:hypothetical protein